MSIPCSLLLLFTCLKTVIFSCGIPINSLWFSGVSREIQNYLIHCTSAKHSKEKERLPFSVFFCKEQDLNKRCSEIRIAPTLRDSDEKNFISLTHCVCVFTLMISVP